MDNKKLKTVPVSPEVHRELKRLTVDRDGRRAKSFSEVIRELLKLAGLEKKTAE